MTGERKEKRDGGRKRRKRQREHYSYKEQLHVVHANFLIAIVSDTSIKEHLHSINKIPLKSNIQCSLAILVIIIIISA